MPERARSHSEERGRRGHDAAYEQQRRWVWEKAIYASRRWKRLRAWVLHQQPLCADPEGRHVGLGREVPCTEDAAAASRWASSA